MLPGRYQDVARTLDVPPCSRDKSGAREVVALLPSQKGTWSSMGTLGTLGLESGTFSSQLPTACATTPCMIIVLLWQQLSSIPPGSLRLHIWSLQMCSNLMSGNITTFMMSPPLVNHKHLHVRALLYLIRNHRSYLFPGVVTAVRTLPGSDLWALLMPELTGGETFSPPTPAYAAVSRASLPPCA
ncbi:C-type natriuretic peptide 3 isoform X1 [Takifugu rubripes]|uniref:C-type natriuretic peptide 3 isoform X1 n=1 Tax=Takifugu rubripes TaxID=31033 RepID=UPI001145B682|nr:C-type natriuretic peptide 3 isoform X1 [Takifugu rubripes]